MTDQKITKYVADWFARADEDLDIAQLILDEERPYNPACFHEQQAAEKYLKGFLAHHEKHVRKIHDLDALLQECVKIVQSFENLQDSARYLNRFYVESRYPDDYVEFTREDAENGFESALRIKEFVLEKIKPQQKSGFGIVGIIVIIATVAILGGGYWYWQSRTEVPLPPSSGQSPVVAEGDFTGWKTYRNEKYGFEMKYPAEYMIKTSDVGDEMGLEEIIDIIADSVKTLQIRVTDLDKYLPKTNTPTLEKYQDLFLRKLSNSREIIINDVPAFQYEICGRAACHWQIVMLRNKLEFRIFEPLDVNDAMGKLADGRFPILSIVRSIRFVK